MSVKLGFGSGCELIFKAVNLGTGSAHKILGTSIVADLFVQVLRDVSGLFEKFLINQALHYPSPDRSRTGNARG